MAVRRIAKKLRSLRIKSMEAEEVVNNAYASLTKAGKDHKFLGKRSEFELTDMLRRELGRSSLQRKKRKRGNFEIHSQTLVYKPYSEKEITEEDLEFLSKQYSLNDKQLEVIKFRTEGKTIAEIAKQIGVSDTRIFQIMQEVSKKVKKGMGWSK